MEGDYGISNDEIGLYQAPEDTSEHEPSQTETSTEGFRRRKVTTSGNEEWKKQQRLQKEQREKQHPSERVNNMNQAVKNFRLASSGEGLLRGGFGKLPDGVTNLMEQMKNLSNAMDKFHLTGDNLNVSGSFDKGYTVDRQNPCQQEQDNPNPT